MDVLECILDGTMKPKDLRLALLENITDNFSEDRRIGEGGFATVYKGVLQNGNVAVKRIMNSHTIDDKLFYREVSSLMKVNHKNIVRFLGFCSATDHRAMEYKGLSELVFAEMRERLLCFEYIGNGSLDKYITDELRGLEWSTRYQIIRGICEGLHYLHKEKHIIHMDLKPANILLDDHMVPKITDFGLSRSDGISQTMSTNRFVSLGYCAPEYLHGGRMSAKTDMYSLGIIIIELVTGQRGIPEIANVLRKWRYRWKKSAQHTALEHQQLTKCIEIGLLCQKKDPFERPFIWDIVRDINKMERTNEKMSQIIPAYLEDDMLGIEPFELCFPFGLNKEISCSLELTNETDVYIAFIIQTTSLLQYCMRPNKGIVPPRSSCSVNITLQVQDKVPRDMPQPREFTVWSTKVKEGLTAEDITRDIFGREKGNVVDEVHLDVVFEAQLQAPEKPREDLLGTALAVSVMWSSLVFYLLLPRPLRCQARGR